MDGNAKATAMADSDHDERAHRFSLKAYLISLALDSPSG